jgi:hypothetical protein
MLGIFERQMFKAVPGGYIFQPPPPTRFHHTQAYLVNEAQKQEVEPHLRERPRQGWRSVQRGRPGAFSQEPLLHRRGGLSGRDPCRRACVHHRSSHLRSCPGPARTKRPGTTVSSPRPSVLQSRRAQELSRLAVAPTFPRALRLPGHNRCGRVTTARAETGSNFGRDRFESALQGLVYAIPAVGART